MSAKSDQPAELVRKRKCPECGHPLPLKPNPTLETAQRHDEVRILLGLVFILAAVLMVESAILWRVMFR